MGAVSTLMVWAALAVTGETVLLEFTSPGCAHCRSMEPTIRRLAADGFAVRQIDAQQSPELAAQFNVRNVPTFVLLVDGQPAGGLVGAASYERLVQLYRQPNGGPAPTNGRPNLLDAMFPGRQTAPTSSTAGAPPSRSFDEHASRPPTDSVQQPGMQPSGLQQPNAQQLGVRQPGALPNAAPPAAFGAAPAPAGQAMTNAQRLALQATVRIRVEDDGGHSVATGTIVDVHGAEALVLTCGHVFKEAGTKGRIKVDLFVPGAGQPVAGQLLDFDLVRDVGVIAITPGLPVTPVRVAAGDVGIAKGDSVFSVGCDHGGPARVVPTQVAALNKYLGPANIVVSGAPADGRSGGGLFTADGRLIGICNAADPADNEGLFASLPSIHWLLTHVGQGRLIDGPLAAEPKSSVAAANMPGDSLPTGLTVPASHSPAGYDRASYDPQAMPATPGGFGAAAPAAVAPAAAAAAATAAGLQSDGNEYILLIRSKSDRTRPPEAHVLDHVPTELLNRVRVPHQPPANQIAPRGPQPSPRMPESAPAPIMRGQSPGWLPFPR